MKTNVSIKFNSIEEYRIIEKKLEEMGYENGKSLLCPSLDIGNVVIYENIFAHHLHEGVGTEKTYNNLEEFLND